MTAAELTHSGWGLSSGMKCMIQIPCSIRALFVGLLCTAAMWRVFELNWAQWNCDSVGLCPGDLPHHVWCTFSLSCATIAVPFCLLFPHSNQGRFSSFIWEFTFPQHFTCASLVITPLHLKISAPSAKKDTKKSEKDVYVYQIPHIGFFLYNRMPVLGEIEGPANPSFHRITKVGKDLQYNQIEPLPKLHHVH